MTRRNLRHVPLVLSLAAVITVYAFFASHGTFAFDSITWDQDFSKPGEGYYASLAEGFLRGHLHMADEPDPRLAQVANPYSYDERAAKQVSYLWDTSYYHGRYYLYFTPIPALLVHIPYRFLTGAYPHDTAVGLFFAAWTAIAAALFLRRALALRNGKPWLPLWSWTLLVGLGTLIPAVLSFCRSYEIAILCGTAFSATFAWALARFLATPTNLRLLIASLFLALAIASRPNLLAMAPILAVAVLLARRADLTKAAAIAIAPMALIALGAGWYNYARFGSVTEFGIRYQLTYQNMAEWRVCSCRTPREALRLVNTAALYVGAPVRFNGDFPFATLPGQNLDPALSFNQFSDEMAGLGVVLPVAILGSIFAIVLASRRDANDDGTRAGLLVAGGGWLVLAGLSACWYASTRYELDFTILIAAGAAICTESGLSMLSANGLRAGIARAALAVLAVYSVLLGIALGFSSHGVFAYDNADTYKALEAFFR